jgi:ATP-dependent Zn protease
MADAAHQHCTRAWYLRPPVWILGVVLLGLAAFGIVELSSRPSPAALSYSDFLAQLDAGNVASVTFAGTEVDGKFNRPVAQAVPNGSAVKTIFRSQVPNIGDPTLLPELRKQHVAIDVVSSSSWLSWLGRLPWPMVLILAFILIAGLIRLVRGNKASTGSAVPTHPMGGLITGLFGKQSQPTSPSSQEPGK